RYDILSNTWKILAPCPAGQFQPAAGAIGNKTYLVGGNETPTATYIYDIATNTWSTGPTTNVPHSWTNGTAIGNRLLVVCGLDVFKDTNTVETATEPCKFRVLVVAADCANDESNLRASLLAEPGIIGADFFDGSGTPTLAQLQQ